MVCGENSLINFYHNKMCKNHTKIFILFSFFGIRQFEMAENDIEHNNIIVF